MTAVVTPPSAATRDEARQRVDALAKPTGALGRLEDLAVWLAACQDRCPPEPVENVRAVVFAGDHGVAAYGVSAYPAAVTPAMVRLLDAGDAGVAVLARQHGVRLRVLDIAVNDDLADVPARVRAFKVRRSSGPIHLRDALTRDEVAAALTAGRAVADEEIAAGAQLLISGDMGIGNTTPAAALIAAGLGVPAGEVTGRGTGIDDPALAHKKALIETALTRAGNRVADPVDALTALGSADIAAGVGFLLGAARAGVPVLLDGIVSVAAALLADQISPGAVAWCAAGHRSTEPAQSLALIGLHEPALVEVCEALGAVGVAEDAIDLHRHGLLGEARRDALDHGGPGGATRIVAYCTVGERHLDHLESPVGPPPWRALGSYHERTKRVIPP